MPRRSRVLSDRDRDSKCAAQLRFSQIAATCAHSGELQVISQELLSTARELVQHSRALRGRRAKWPRE